VILEPIKPSHWPKHIFETIRIDDPAFVRLDQGPTPPATCAIIRWRATWR
jgi:hypothetical protein